MDHVHFSNLSFSCPRRLCMKFEQHWPRGFRGKVIWNYQHFFHTNVSGPYKCIQKQTWPRRKKVKCQCMTIILATLVDRPFASLGGSVGCAVRLETRRSRVQPPPRSATFFRGDWSWNIFYGHSLPSADSRRAVVSFWRKNVHSTG